MKNRKRTQKCTEDRTLQKQHKQHMYIMSISIKIHEDIQFFSPPYPLDLSVVAAGERYSDRGTGVQCGQATSGQHGSHPGSPR